MQTIAATVERRPSRQVSPITHGRPSTEIGIWIDVLTGV